jgi:hypothetical protein
VTPEQGVSIHAWGGRGHKSQNVAGRSGWVRFGPPQQLIHRGQEIFGLKRFGEDVVRSQLFGGTETVLHRESSTTGDSDELGHEGLGPHFPQYFKTVYFRQDHFDDHYVRGTSVVDSQRLLAVGGMMDLITRAIE